MYEWVHNLPRGVGHTTAAARSGAIVMVPTERQANMVKRQYRGKAMNFYKATKHYGGRGAVVRPDPVVFDVHTVQVMVGSMNHEIERLQAKLDLIQTTLLEEE